MICWCFYFAPLSSARTGTNGSWFASVRSTDRPGPGSEAAGVVIGRESFRSVLWIGRVCVSRTFRDVVLLLLLLLPVVHE